MMNPELMVRVPWNNPLVNTVFTVFLPEERHWCQASVSKYYISYLCPRPATDSIFWRCALRLLEIEPLPFYSFWNPTREDNFLSERTESCPKGQRAQGLSPHDGL